ncbi:hypothetical protein CVT24_011981 [Panaeolus cyanescens]|uniref:O-methyltransferase C-terminal domain-containing protein n=1 Tax=Panaeolus cyanescens TaxID=181874 RepID=A0A409VZ01_9AGAR|nr:hypothetical protein CVT24_011981 [Panaeolus cyanescens]
MPPAHAPDVVTARLEQLLSSIETSAAQLKQHLARRTHNAAKNEDSSSFPSYPFYDDPDACSSAFLMKMACERLITLVTPPHLTVMEQCTSFFTTAAMRICLEHNVAQHIYDLSEGDRGAPLQELSQAAMLDQELMTEVCNGSSKIGAYAEEKFNTSKQAGEDVAASPGLTPFGMYSGLPIYQWFHRPENQPRAQNFNQAMRGLARAMGFASILSDYPFNKLPPNTTLVDAGGGIGAMAEMILPVCPTLKMVVQDLEPVIEAAKSSPSDVIQGLMAEGRVSFEAHDFLKNQKEDLRGSAFLVCHVLLNQSDADSLQILKCIRNSDPSRLLIIDRLYGPFFPNEATSAEGEKEIYDTIRESYANTQDPKGRPGSQVLGGVFDMIMASMFVTKTRTLEQWVDLLTKAGYSLVGITPLRASFGHAVIEAKMV